MTGSSENEKRSVLFAVDVGGTSTRAALVQASNDEILARDVIPTPLGELERLLVGLDGLKRRLERRAGLQADGVGLAFACPVDPRTGTIGLSDKLGLEPGTDVVGLLQERMPLPCLVGTELSMAALGEYVCGAGQGHSDLVVLSIGTGIGAGVIAGGELLLGASGSAGEVAHHPIDLSNDARPCLCGRKGCLEAYACAGSVTFVDGTPSPSTPRQVLEAARAGDAAALEAVRTTGRYIGLTLVICINVYNPELIVLRGGFGRAIWPLIAPQARHIVETASLVPDTPVAISPLADDGVFFGLAAQWKRGKHGEDPTDKP
jgi:glucokinase